LELILIVPAAPTVQASLAFWFATPFRVRVVPLEPGIQEVPFHFNARPESPTAMMLDALT
jgi:hypothetical protein